MSREFTNEEIRRQLLEYIWHLIDYWEKEDRPKDTRERLEGVAFSILSTLDGASAALPSFVIAPCPCKVDRAYHESRGENWYPENDDVEINGDIGGTLHDEFIVVGREMGFVKDSTGGAPAI